ncbi:MAG: STAS domain-containing protein [Peptoniphilaceae bacterium]|nr:STAS domain-containing protein [Peptoniphilaceae bacterium]MDY6018916.1 STAS domain-containing protein [Anaerococcus sp.]
MFDKKITRTDDLLTVELKGDLDVYFEKEFKEFAKENLLNEDIDMVFDFKYLNYIDSTGLGLFMNLYKNQKEKNKSIKIINAKDNIYKLFKITDLTELFNMEK